MRDGKVENIEFKDGLLVERKEGKNHIVDSVTHEPINGTYVTWKPDPQFFTSPKTDVKYFKSFFNDITCLCPNLVVTLNDEEIHHPNGISDFIDNHLAGNIEITNNRLIIQESNGSNKLDLALTFCGNSSSRIIPYVNYGLTESGPHITAIKSTITRVMNNWAKENGLLKKGDKNLDGASVQEGMLLVCNIVSKNVAYNAQVKTAITKMDTSFITSTLGKALEFWLDCNPDAGKAIIEKALLSRKAAEAAKKAREAVKNKATKKVVDKALKLPTTLQDAWSKKRLDCELFICEGKSAASGLVAARDSETQAVYGVRGKMLSVLKTTPDKVVKNQEINNILEALGLDYNSKTGKCIYDKNKLRYGKIIAAADADYDGFAIENLLFNILWYLCPELIINGHVYSSVPPLYRVTTKKNEYIYLKDDNALNEYKKVNANKIAVIGRMKGLGECDDKELSYCLLEPESRNLYQLQVSDIEKTENMFQDLYGKAVPPRVKFLSEHLEEAQIIV